MVSKDAFHVRLIFPATGLDSETLKGLGIVASPAAVGRAHIGDMFHVPMGVDKEAKLPGMDKVKNLAVTLKDLTEYFKGYKVEQIELWISGTAETPGFFNLIIAAKGEGGVKVVLKSSE